MNLIFYLKKSALIAENHDKIDQIFQNSRTETNLEFQKGIIDNNIN
jgi:hypothetical protein